MDVNAIIFRAVAVILSCNGIIMSLAFVNQYERKCNHSHSNRMLRIQCRHMELKEVPKNLKTSVEILDLSYNRIRKLSRSSFQFYKNTKSLLLFENMIQFVEPGTFQSMTDLEEIDLATNGLLTVPLELFQMPSLRNMYIDSNNLVNLEKDLEILEKPIKAPLEYLNVAECGLENIPDIGVLPNLWQINASRNPLSHFDIKRLANYCRLKNIDLTTTSLSNCACQQVNSHLRYLNVELKYVPVCSGVLPIETCPLPYNETVESLTFEICKTSVTHAEKVSRTYWISGVALSVAIVLLFVCCICYRRRKQSRAAKHSIPLKPRNRIVSPKNGINNNKRDLERSSDDCHRCDDDLLKHCDKIDEEGRSKSLLVD